MDASQAFSAVERGTSVSATGNTGAAFSFASSANQGGGTTGGLGGFRGLGGGGLGGMGGLSSLFGGLNNQSQQNARPPIRTRLRSAVIVAPHSPQLVERRAGQRIQAFAPPGLEGGLNVTMEGRRAVVTGVVADERQRRMSEMLLRLEPGVSEIDNRIEVAGP
jgi:hypothetical protein